MGKGPSSFCFVLPIWFVLFLTLARQAQLLPDLPPVIFESFGPEIREQVRKAYAEAQAKPRDAEAVGRLGMTLHTYEQYEFAAGCYARAHHLAPNEFRWIYYLGVVQAAVGNHREAVTSLREALQRQPDYLPAQLRLADSLFALGNLGESQQLYEAVAKRNGAIAQAQYGLGRIKTARGEVAAGVEHYRKALESFQDYGAAHYALGLALRDLGQTDKAREHLALSEKYKYRRPPLPDSLLAAIAELNRAGTELLKRGLMLESAGQIAESIAAHEQALELNSNLVQAYINLIVLYGRRGELEKAAQAYRAVVAINPNLADSHYNYGVLLAEQGRYSEAAQAFHRSLQINPFHSEAHHNYAVMIEREGRWDEAAEHYRKALENKPGHRLAHFHLGRILVNQGRLAEAIEHFQQTLVLEDENTPRFLYALGATYARAGDTQKGLHYLREALKRAASLEQTQLARSIERDLRTLEQAVEKRKPEVRPWD